VRASDMDAQVVRLRIVITGRQKRVSQSSVSSCERSVWIGGVCC